MNKIIWTGDRFECNNLELEDAKFEALRGENKRLHEFMAACDLSMDGYGYDINWNLHIHRKTDQGKVVLLPIADEGTGFNVCFHLGAYAIASMNLGQKLEICAYSFKPVLHPVLFDGLSNWFSDRKTEEIDRSCPYYSGDSTLKCAVNPSLPCKDCNDVSAGFNENLFVWTAVDISDRVNEWMKKLEESAMQNRRSSIEAMRQAFMSAQERSPSTIRIPHATMGVDVGSGQDATAIATGLTTEDGAIRIDRLEVRDESVIERMRTEIEIARVDHRLLGAYQCGLSDRIAPLPPRLEEARREYEEEIRRRRIWFQYSGMPIHPRPQPCAAPRFLHGVLEDAGVNLPRELGMSLEEVAELRANGTLYAELHRRSQLRRGNRVNGQQE